MAENPSLLYRLASLGSLAQAYLTATRTGTSSQDSKSSLPIRTALAIIKHFISTGKFKTL